MKYMLLIIAALAFSAVTRAQDVVKQKYNENKLLEDQVGYTHAVKSNNTLYISGTVATGDMTAQIKSIMESIQETLQKYGASFQNVVKENIYTTNLDSFKYYRVVHNKYFNNDYPAATWVEVKALYLPQFLVEIEVTAELPPPPQPVRRP
jgi:enamine deaminase RidA (YjgF/YER057c/UK114 family)